MDVAAFLCIFTSLPVLRLGHLSGVISRLAFMIPMITFHSVGAVRSIFPKYERDAKLAVRILLCSDVHYVTILFCVIIADLIPRLYVVLYIYVFTIRSLTCLVYRTPFSENPKSSRIRQFIKNGFLTTIPSYIEIALGFQLIFFGLGKRTLRVWILIFVYFGWLLLFNFASSSVHARVWAAISLFLRERAAEHAETFGPTLERILDRITEFGMAAATIYPSRELKVHLH
jgi:hypothetical protein